MRLGIFGQNMSALDTEAGIDGLAKMLRSNKLNPDMITNYTKVVFKDRLEVLLGKNKIFHFRFMYASERKNRQLETR